MTDVFKEAFSSIESSYGSTWSFIVVLEVSFGVFNFWAQAEAFFRN
jgi:hypothetical protein